jgi:hypothetical protein
VNSFGQPMVLLNSADGLPNALNLARGVHANGSWAFRASGTYQVVVGS